MKTPSVMQKKVAVTVLAGAVVLGVATGAVAGVMGREEGTPSVRPTATPSSASPTPEEESPPAAGAPVAQGGGTETTSSPEPPALVGVSQLLVTPGAVGPVTVGMTKQEALGTGYLLAPDPSSGDGCPAPALAWKDGYDGVLDVQASGNGDILSIGVRQQGPRTRSGYGIGTTWGELKAVGEEPVEAGYGQTGVRVYDAANAGWIGFLFDTTVDQLSDADTVTFMEVTKGAQPDLMRDGC